MLNRKSLISKDKRGKDFLPKPPSSPGPIRPPSLSVPLSVSDVDDRISSHLTELSSFFDHKLAALQAIIMDSFSSLQILDHTSMPARMSHDPSFSAPPVPGPSHGLDPSLLNPKVLSALTESFRWMVMTGYLLAYRLPSTFPRVSH